jgi:hypothetical protein
MSTSIFTKRFAHDQLVSDVFYEELNWNLSDVVRGLITLRRTAAKDTLNNFLG